MEDVKKIDEATKPEELAERAPLTDEQLDQASGGLVEGIKLVRGANVCAYLDK